ECDPRRLHAQAAQGCGGRGTQGAQVHPGGDVMAGRRSAGSLMELQQLRYFVAVIENKTMHAASRSLGLSQPALTRSIQDLERRMKVSLFERDARGVQPTGAGLDLLHHAKSVLRACGDAKEDAIRVDRSRSGD